VSRSVEPVVIFTEFRDSLDALAAQLAGVRPVAVMHGGLSAAARSRELTRFLNGEASALLATDVAGQGLNLHSRARWVVSLELPWQPHRLEQRIGRVDRIGQPRRPHLTLLVGRHAMESAVLSRLAARTVAARHAVGDQMFGGINPSRLAMADVLIGGRASLDEASCQPLVTMAPRRWARLAAAEARAVEHRRRSRALVRTPHTRRGGESWPLHRPGVSRLTHRPVWWPDDCGVILAFLVAIADESGIVVGRCVVLTRSPAWPASKDEQRALMAAAGSSAHSTATRTCDRWSRRRRGTRACSLDPALEVALREQIGRRTTVGQPGLFDRRFERQAAGAQTRVVDAAREVAEREEAGSHPIRALPPSLELVLYLA
jgi:hypothetical protein